MDQNKSLPAQNILSAFSSSDPIHHPPSRPQQEQQQHLGSSKQKIADHQQQLQSPFRLSVGAKSNGGGSSSSPAFYASLQPSVSPISQITRASPGPLGLSQAPQQRQEEEEEDIELHFHKQQQFMEQQQHGNSAFHAVNKSRSNADEQIAASDIPPESPISYEKVALDVITTPKTQEGQLFHHLLHHQQQQQPQGPGGSFVRGSSDLIRTLSDKSNRQAIESMEEMWGSPRAPQNLAQRQSAMISRAFAPIPSSGTSGSGLDINDQAIKKAESSAELAVEEDAVSEDVEEHLHRFAMLNVNNGMAGSENVFLSPQAHPMMHPGTSGPAPSSVSSSSAPSPVFLGPSASATGPVPPVPVVGNQSSAANSGSNIWSLNLSDAGIVPSPHGHGAANGMVQQNAASPSAFGPSLASPMMYQMQPNPQSASMASPPMLVRTNQAAGMAGSPMMMPSPSHSMPRMHLPHSAGVNPAAPAFYPLQIQQQQPNGIPTISYVMVPMSVLAGAAAAAASNGSPSLPSHLRMPSNGHSSMPPSHGPSTIPILDLNSIPGLAAAIASSMGLQQSASASAAASPSVMARQQQQQQQPMQMQPQTQSQSQLPMNDNQSIQVPASANRCLVEVEFKRGRKGIFHFEPSFVQMGLTSSSSSPTPMASLGSSSPLPSPSFAAGGGGSSSASSSPAPLSSSPSPSSSGAPPGSPPNISLEEFVFVEADRGEDLGQVTQILPLSSEHAAAACGYVLRKATLKDVQKMTSKSKDEAKAVMIAQQRVIERGLDADMQIVDAEFQFDRKKLTYFYLSEKRIDFRDLVRELYKYARGRIWMTKVGGMPTPNNSTGSNNGNNGNASSAAPALPASACASAPSSLAPAPIFTASFSPSPSSASSSPAMSEVRNGGGVGLRSFSLPGAYNPAGVFSPLAAPRGTIKVSASAPPFVPASAAGAAAQGASIATFPSDTFSQHQ